MRYKERIISDYKIMLGKPIVQGTRITVESTLKKMAEEATKNEILWIYPNLSKENVNAVLEYTSEVIGNEDVIDLSWILHLYLQNGRKKNISEYAYKRMLERF